MENPVKKPFYGDYSKGRLTTTHRGNQIATMSLGSYQGFINLTVYPNPPKQGPGSDGPKRISATFLSDTNFHQTIEAMRNFFNDTRQVGEYNISLKAEKFVNNPETGRKTPKMLPASSVHYGRREDGMCWIMVKEFGVSEEVRFNFEDTHNFPEMYLGDGSKAPISMMSKAMALGWLKKIENQYMHYLEDDYAAAENKRIEKRKEWQESRNRGGNGSGGGNYNQRSNSTTQHTPVSELDDDIMF